MICCREGVADFRLRPKAYIAPSTVNVSFCSKRASLALGNDHMRNDLRTIWALLIGMMQTALVSQHAVNLAKTCKRQVSMKRLKDPLHRMWVRRHLVKLQGGLCCYCGRSFTKRGPTSPTIEHKKAIMDGGTDDLANLAAACLHCNQHRGHAKESEQTKG